MAEQTFTLTNKNIDYICSKYNQSASIAEKIKECENNLHQKIIHTTNKLKYFNCLDDDQLFWYFYITFKSNTEYSYLKNKYAIEKETKIELISEIRKNKEMLKTHKWKRAFIENNLVYDTRITLETFICICSIHKINVMYVNNNTFYEINQYGHKYILIKKINNMYILYDNDDVMTRIEEIRINKWQMLNITKPLRNITVYKLKELQDIAIKFRISILRVDGKKRTKAVLYSLILNQITV
jgi:hypothetical protein